MKNNMFKYIAIAAAFLATAVNASAQYKIEGGVGTSKQVTGPDSNGDYTIRLETFATGSTTVTESSTPVDVVLVLDVSGSMDFPKGSTTQVANNTNISYNTVANSDQEYFYRSGDNYYRIYAERSGNTYYLRYNKAQNSGNGTNLGSSNSATGTIITTNNTNTSWMGDNRVRVYTGQSRMTALKNATKAFIDEIEKNDHLDKNGDEREERLGNQIAIVKFAGTELTTVGNSTYTESTATYNNTQTVISLTPTENNVQTLKDAVDGFVSRGGTMANNGMNRANAVLNGIPSDRESNRVVVMFTDGEPGSSGFSGNDGGSTAVNTIANANTSKNTHNALVYTVGLFDSTPASTSNVYKYLNAVSSNYTTATGSWNNNTLTITGTQNSTQDYYKDASGNVDLTAIFVSISQGIGGSTETIGSQTQVRDVVTNSFVLPGTVTAADVHVYTSAATGDASGTDETNPAGWATPVDITSSVTPTIVNVDADGNPTDDATKVKNKALFVEGFDYSKDDTNEGDGDGNWVGVRFKNNRYFWAGKKLIITFKVKADPQATGGETLPNMGTSGVYKQNEDGTYTCINNYEQPHTTLTVNIKIRKTGLRHGESATFELMRIRPKGYNPEGATNKEKIANIEYNLIGKPVPDTHPYSGTATQPDMSDYYEGMGWQGFKKVILTNKGDNGAEVVKNILALDPYWVYLVLEDDWGWAYTMTGDTNQEGADGTYTTSSVEVNPFRFHNEEKPDAVKHAEAIMINHFKSSLSGSKVEHDKSSKVESF
jgi:hypothetical protein